MDELWNTLKEVLSSINIDFLNSLAEGANQSEIEELHQISLETTDLQTSLQIINGQNTSHPPFYQRFSLFSTDEIVANHELMNTEVVPDLIDSGINLDEGESIGPVKPQIWNAKWTPFAGDGGNFLCIDFDPDQDGQSGQVFSWWRDGSPNEWLAPSYRAWLEQYATDLEAGKYKWDSEEEEWSQVDL